MTKKIKTLNGCGKALTKAIDTILGGEVKLPKTTDTKRPKIAKDDPTYTKLKKLGTMPNEKATINNKEIMIVREGITDKALGKVFLDSNLTKEQKDSRLAQYLFEQGREHSSFLMELFASKGAHTKESRIFKSQIRFDFEMLADILSTLLRDIGDGLLKEKNSKKALQNMAIRFRQGSEMLVAKIDKVKEARMAEKGYGIYLDNAGRPY